MSRYGWEEGTLILPTKAVKPVFDHLCQKQNLLMDVAYEHLMAAYETILAEKKTGVKPDGSGLRGRILTGIENHYRKTRSLFSLDDLYHATEEAVHAMAYAQNEAGAGIERKIPTKPQKKYLVKASTSTTTFCKEEASATFDRKRHTLTWVINENNHAVDRAWASWLGLALRQALQKVQWTRATGGIFVGNDEYNRDERENGGGANYVTARFGPLGEQSSAHRGRRR